MKVRCIDASNQPRLNQNQIYRVALDVTRGQRPNQPEPVQGYVLMIEGDVVAIPYVYDRRRFEIVKEH